MKLTVNGTVIDREGQPTVRALLDSLGVLHRRVALMINGDVLPRDAYEHTVLREGDVVDVLSLAGGG